RSFFGRIIYSFKNRYLLQANVRADASSRFAKQYRWGVFPSVSAGWVISEEPWFNNKGFINYLKLRGSYGQLGNERIGSEFPYQALMEFGNSYMYDKGSKSVSAIQIAHQTYYAFENITWETTTSTGLGIDAALLDSRLSLTLDGYYKKTSNMLLTLGFPSYAGFSAPQQNAGDMNTWGWDLTLGWADRAGDFWYNVSANISDYRSKMGYLGDRRNISGNYITEEGSYFQEWYVYKNAGIIQTEADMLNPDGSKIAVLNKSDKPGCIKYVDQNGDGVINADDKVKLGNSLPEYLYGANFSMGWKGWDFNMSFQGIGHQLVMFDTARIQPGRRQWGAVPSILLGNYWSKHNTEEENLKAKYPYVTWNNTGNIYAGSDFWLFNGAYFRVKNITLGYTIPANILSKTFVKNLRLYASVTDLPAISNYPKQWDPEVATNSTYISTSYIFGLNVKF
ncbi:MAG: SusC/RagA family TonB-linked outer membrane protein, partial [Bacteroidales bacterium]|nr:SusC/RagA family TonB-linked outer membrane protein [Bacteroidales bacterium]